MERSASILHVEDDPIDVANLQRAFSRCGVAHPLHAASSGEEALARLRGSLDSGRLRPGIILLDLNMPGMGGLEFLRAMKADPALRTIPVVVFTSSREDSDRLLAYSLGASGYVVKPIDFDEFVEAVRVVERYWSLCELAESD
jgi:CheY-like chemotaxis protein